jgi:hypothetical protein
MRLVSPSTRRRNLRECDGTVACLRYVPSGDQESVWVQAMPEDPVFYAILGCVAVLLVLAVLSVR